MATGQINGGNSAKTYQADNISHHALQILPSKLSFAFLSFSHIQSDPNLLDSLVSNLPFSFCIKCFTNQHNNSLEDMPSDEAIPRT